MDKVFYSLQHHFNVFLTYLPAFFAGIICFILTLFVARIFSRAGTNYSFRRTRDTLISAFIGRIAWTIVFIIGTVLALGLIGLGGVSNKILAGAGITTFIIGFALKDIGENFLAGLILAFSRPYREGSLIECDGIKGVVRSMTMRQTTVEAENGRIVLIPNSAIIKQPLTKYMDSDMDMRQEFYVNVELDKARQAVELINETVGSFDYVLNNENKPIKVFVDSLNGEKAKLHVIFWFDTKKFEGSRSGTKSEIMLAVFDHLKARHLKYSG